MKNQTFNRIFLSLGLMLVSVVLGSCSGITGSISFGGYVIDVSTNQAVKDFEMTVETASGSSDVSNDSDTGKFSFSMDPGTDYIITVKKTGYRDFVSSNRYANPSTEDHVINENQQLHFSVPMVPTTAGTPAINVTVVDLKSGANITTGSYRITSTSLTAGIQTGIYGDGGNTGMRWWLADAPVLAGAIAEGVFTVAANALMPGYVYEVATFGVTGYLDSKSAIALSTASNVNVSKNLVISLTSNAVIAAPTLVGQSNIDSSGVPVPLASARTIVFTFDRNISINTSALKGVGSNSMMSVVATADNDVDGSTTSTTMATETVGSTAMSSNITIAASGNKITLTFAADSSLITGTIDTDDDLSFLMNATLLGGISIRDANTTNDSWTTMATLVSTATLRTVVVRSNFP